MRNLLVDAAVDQIDGGSTFGVLKFLAASSTVICINTFDSTAFGAAAAAVATANTITDGNSSTAGTVTEFLIASATEDNAAILGSVTSTGAGGDIQLSSNVISSVQTISITSLIYTGLA
jgi:hypothetical protein